MVCIFMNNIRECPFIVPLYFRDSYLIIHSECSIEDTARYYNLDKSGETVKLEAITCMKKRFHKVRQ